MNILNFFSKSKNTRKNTESAAPTLQMKDLYETKDYESFFENYSKELENKYTLIDLDSFLNITQGLLVSLYFKKSEQEVNLNKIFKFFHFFGSTRTHELKKLYTSWAQEFYNEHQKPLFKIDNRNGYTVSPEFLDYIYNKIVKW